MEYAITPFEEIIQEKNLWVQYGPLDSYASCIVAPYNPKLVQNPNTVVYMEP